MSLLKNVKSQEGVEQEKDVLGGAGVLDSGAYPFKVGMAYVAKSEGGAVGLFLTFKGENNKEVRQTLWMTSGDKKGNKNTYQDKNGKDQYLPGYLLANSLSQLTTGKEIGDLEEEEKVINLYSYELKKEVPTKALVLTELLNQDIVVGLIRETVDKTKETSPGSKEYVATGETRDQNEIEKFFCGKEDYLNMTLTEVQAKAEKAEFYSKWVEKNTGVTKNKAKGASGTAGAPKAAAGGTAKPSKSLFS